ncbi:MAG: hypothetical protein DHS20C05_19340 [Hyphococcus sp.]|nr:MAG: hypothetical protein DHS20C05_19340 [Marinicaulis sp.]
MLQQCSSGCSNSNNKLGTLVVCMTVFIFISACQSANSGSDISFCDEDGNRYATEADARAAGLEDYQYGATMCPEYKPHLNDKSTFVGLAEDAAKERATELGLPFRVVKRDGNHLPVTKDYRRGRINADVEDDVVVDYQVE